jgi:sigma-54 dependent transcriptional regulator, acetoin dehydrogenase operon transcriptional activator AcoR
MATGLPYPVPSSPQAQHRVALEWHAANAQGRAADGVRPVVRDSWNRALDAHIRPDTREAPIVWSAEELVRARSREAWLQVALRALAVQRGAYAAAGSVVALFDRHGHMLHSEGEARAVDGLAAINFRPGALWAEEVVGTNGPGTTLATGQAVHVVGAEHCCEEWQDWHCAAAPLRDPLTGRMLGALDVSGYRGTAHPHTLMLVTALAAAIEQTLAAQELERRAQLLARLADLVARWPGDSLIGVDRTGAVVGSSPAAPAALHPLAPLPERLREAVAELVACSRSEAPWQATLPIAGGVSVIVHPVMQGSTVVGACLLVEADARRRTAPATATRSTARPPTRYVLADLVGESAALREAHRIAIAAASNTLPVLLLGESGTGKEVFAQGIHGASDRAAKPFIAVNCAALPAELVESELFGYVGGAFSGARREGGIGKFEAANGGTIFLDEVGDLPVAAQAALLRVLQEGEVTRVGATRGVPVDVRVIAATNRDIDDALRTGAFREDLYYRLGVLSVRLPSLRERHGDVERLAHRFLAEAEAELGREGHVWAPATLDALRAYAWPGNIRELRNLVWRTVALATRSVITPESLPGVVGGAWNVAAGALNRGGEPGDGGDDIVAALTGNAASSDEWNAERERVVRAVEQASSMGEAARILGIARSTLYRQIERYGLEPKRVLRH